MTDRDALLAAIRADPDCDTARLVFADWLQEQGEYARAEFIRRDVAQRLVAHKASGWHAEEDWIYDTIEERGREWFAPPTGQWGEVYGRWLATEKATAIHMRIGRGFVYHVMCRADMWLKFCDTILAHHPVQNVTLTTPVERGHDHRGNGFLILAAGDRRYTTDLPWRGCLIPPVERVLGAVWKGVTFEVRPVGFQVPHAPVPQDIVDAGDQYFDNLVAGMPMPAEYLTPEGK